MNAKQFWTACQTFDWFYEMSDDPTVWHRGQKAEAQLLQFAPHESENRLIWDAFKAHHYSGSAFGTEKKPLPQCPV